MANNWMAWTGRRSEPIADGMTNRGRLNQTESTTKSVSVAEGGNRNVRRNKARKSKSRSTAATARKIAKADDCAPLYRAEARLS